MGESEGLEVVGPIVGDTDGDTVGDTVGTELGLVVGGGVLLVGLGVVGAGVVGGAEGDELGAELGSSEGELVGAGDTVGGALGDALGLPVGGSVFRMHRLERYSESSSRSSACNGRTPRCFAGLLSIIHKADPYSMLDSFPTPMAKRSTLSSVSASISDWYCVTASTFMHSLGPRTQSW